MTKETIVTLRISGGIDLTTDDLNTIRNGHALNDFQQALVERIQERGLKLVQVDFPELNRNNFTQHEETKIEIVL